MFETARLPLIQTTPRQIGHSDADGFRHLPKIAGVGAAYVLQSDGSGGSFWGPVSGASVASVFGRTGAVLADAADYAGIYQPVNSKLTAFAALANGSGVLTNDGSGGLSWTAAGGGGTVTSVGLSLPSIFTVSGSPVTTNGTLSATLANQAAGLVLASPAGSTGAPSFRAIASTDLPATIAASTTGSAATLTTARTLTIGSTGKTFNGAGNVAWSVAEIGALPASGGTTNRLVKWASGTAQGLSIASDDGTTFSVAGNVQASKFSATSDGLGENYQVGNDLWLGDINVGNTAQLKGRPDPTKAYLKFGTSGPTVGCGGSGAPFDVIGDLRLPGCLFSDDVFSSTGYAVYPSGVTPSNTNAVIYFAKNGTVTGISGSGSASLSINGSPIASATSAGLSIPGLSGSGLIKAGVGGLLQAAVVADIPGGPYLPLSAGSSKPITGILSLQNNLEIMDGKSITSLGATVLTIGTPWYGPGILFPWTASTISGIDFQVDGRSKFVGLLNPAGGIAGDISGGDAPSQGVGEYITSALSNTETVSITATSIFDMTSIELPAGDWDVDATIIGKANIAAAARLRAAISTSTATIVSDGREAESSPPTGSAVYTTLTMHKRILTSAPMTVYLSAQLICSSFGAAVCWGNITARRRR